MGAPIATARASVIRPGLAINPRSAWGADLPPGRALAAEDVKFLIVHHSASQTWHRSEDVPSILRGWYDFHTGPEKGWADIAYNFVVDSEGVVWEGRQGSITGPVAGDATGGNQGFSQLVCVIGDYDQATPTSASLSSLVAVLAWLSDRYDVDTGPGSEATFVSKGSNRWPVGTVITTPTITGHRAMSKTSCPGASLNAYVVGGLMEDVDFMRGGTAPAASLPQESGTSTTMRAAPITRVAATGTTTVNPVMASPSVSTPGGVARATGAPESSGGVVLGTGLGAALLFALLVWRRRRMGN